MNYTKTKNMPNEKIKPLIPTLREKKRYMSFEIISRQSFDFSSVKKAIFDEYKNLFGEKGFSEAGLIMLSNKYFEEKKSGIIRVSHKKTESLRVVLASIQKINGHEAIIKSINTSGMLNKAEKSIANSDLSIKS